MDYGVASTTQMPHVVSVAVYIRIMSIHIVTHTDNSNQGHLHHVPIIMGKSEAESLWSGTKLGQSNTAHISH